MSDLLRHILACNNTSLPGGRVRLRVAGAEVGWLAPAMAERLRAMGMGIGTGASADGVTVPPAGLQQLARHLAAEGAFRWRDEAFDVRASPDGPVLAQLDRGALPAFGVEAAGAHLNGLVEGGGETRLWVGRRAAHKALDPGKLDHLAAGGVAAGDTPDSTIVKEGAEEAGLPAALSRQARPVAVIAYTMQRPEGLRRDRLHCYDLMLPESFTPEPHDDEVAAFELWPLSRVLHTLRHTDAFKFNVTLVLIDLLIRRGLIGAQEAAPLRAALNLQSPA